MKKLGLGRKKEDGDEDSNRSALFGGRKSKSPAPPASSNPYAVNTPADIYNQAKAKAGVPGYVNRQPSPAPPSAQQGGYGGPPPSQQGRGGYGGMNGGYPDDKKANPYGSEKQSGSNGGYLDDKRPSPYGSEKQSGSNGGTGEGSGKGGGYGADRYGAQSGYGGDRYGSGGPQSEAGGSRYGPGGYGGLGRTTSHATDATDDNRDALFGGARERVQQRTQQQMGYGAPPPYEEPQSGEGQPGGYGGSSGPSYGAYGDRQLTAEEEEEEDVQATKQQIRFIKQEDVSSTRNALRIAAQAEETGMNTLARIGAQGERIHKYGIRIESLNSGDHLLTIK